MLIKTGARSLDIPPEKRYHLPQDLSVKMYSGFALLISPENGNWIVLENQVQIDIYKALMNGKSVGEVSEDFKQNANEIHSVLRQIEGRHFEFKISADENNFALRIYLTNACNLRCRHCFVYAGTAHSEELSLEEIENLITSCHEDGANKLILTGGEVLMRKDFEQIIRCGKSAGMYVQVLTNGTLWDETRVKNFSRYIDEVQISIDGFDEKSNAEIRGAQVFDKALTAVDLFYRFSEIFINAVVTPMYADLEKHYDEFVGFAKNLIARYGYERFLIIFQGELLNGRNFIAENDLNLAQKILVDRLHEEIYENSELTTFVLNHRGNRLQKNCGYGGLTVGSTGDIYFCGRISEIKSYGNVRQMAMPEVLALRKKIRRCTSVDNLSPCNECELKYICGGGCRINNFPAVLKISAADLDKNLPLNRSEQCQLKKKYYHLMIESSDYLLE